MAFYPCFASDNIYITRSTPDGEKLFSSIYLVDYKTMHRRFAHPSRAVLRKAREHTQKFPDIEFPSEEPICRGCAEGKMPQRSFPPNYKRATRPFELIHSDLTIFPVDSYHKYKYIITFFDDYSSHAWVMCMRKKSSAITCTKQFLAMVKTQFNATVQRWMSDAGGEYKSDVFDQMLKDNGIQILQSVPHQPQQNGRAERFMRTLMDKAEAMRHEACFPPSWWEFAVEHAAHVYNRTPLRRANWKTPYELVYNEAPAVDHLRVFGCGAYVQIPADVRINKLAPKSELMTYLGTAPGRHGYLFMRKPNNVLCTGATALFDESMFPECDKHSKRRNTRLQENAPDPDQQDQQPNIPYMEDNDDELRQLPNNPPSKGKGKARDDAPDRDRSPSPIPPFLPQGEQPEEQPAPRRQRQRYVPGEPTRRSERTRNLAPRPGNIYGEKKTPLEQYKEIENERPWRKIVGEQPPIRGRTKATSREEQVPGPSSRPEPPLERAPHQSSPGHQSREESHSWREPQPEISSDTSEEEELNEELRDSADEEVQMAKLCREGGVDLINYLLAHAVPPVDGLPIQNVRDWTYRDISRLPLAEQKEWKAACNEELEALHKRKVFELVDRPVGRKVIKKPLGLRRQN